MKRSLLESYNSERLVKINVIFCRVNNAIKFIYKAPKTAIEFENANNADSRLVDTNFKKNATLEINVRMLARMMVDVNI